MPACRTEDAAAACVLPTAPPRCCAMMCCAALCCAVPCRGQVPGFLGGWSRDAPSAEAQAAQFDEVFNHLAVEAKWCCFTWGDADEQFRDLPYALPPPLAGGHQRGAGGQAGAAAAASWMPGGGWWVADVAWGLSVARDAKSFGCRQKCASTPVACPPPALPWLLHWLQPRGSLGRRPNWRCPPGATRSATHMEIANLPSWCSTHASSCAIRQQRN